MFFQFQSIWKSVTLVQYLVLQEHKFGILVLLRYCAHCSSSCWDALAFTRCSVLNFSASSRYLPTFSFSFMMTRWSLGMETSTIYHNLASFSLIFISGLLCLTLSSIFASQRILTFLTFLLYMLVLLFAAIYPLFSSKFLLNSSSNSIMPYFVWSFCKAFTTSSKGV